MQYLPEPSKVVYRAKDGTEEKIFDALEWLAAMCSHIPDRGEQMDQYQRFCYLSELIVQMVILTLILS